MGREAKIDKNSEDWSVRIMESGTSTQRLGALVEVIVVRFVVYALLALVVLQLLYSSVSPDPLPAEAPYIVGSLWFLFPAIMIYGFRRNRQQYGLTLRYASTSIDLTLNAFPFFVLTNVGYLIVIILGWSFLEPLGALLLTGLTTMALLLIIGMVEKKYADFEEVDIPEQEHRKNLLLVLILLLLPIILGFVLNRLSFVLVSTVVWQFVFSGFGEEIFFRGYIQSRLNAAFGRPYSWKGIRFGPGLIITAAIFSISHMLNTANIWFGDFNLAWWWGTFTFVGGLLFGLLREKTGSVVAPGLLHGLEAVGEGLGLLF
jgi:membrane protease YdiL (CAAX protease family)